MKLLKDLYGRAIRAFSRTPQQPRKVDTGSATAFKRQAEDVNRYIWQNPGLNRHERRSLAAKIRSRRFHKKHGVMNDDERKVAKFTLKNTARNIPATVGRLIENIKRRRAGEPILIYRG